MHFCLRWACLFRAVVNFRFFGGMKRARGVTWAVLGLSQWGFSETLMNAHGPARILGLARISVCLLTR
ncbi:hypothetical protein AMTR_s00058p00160660 [Amborella trichopoda]|uniref:Secreted protein n=1 Tax=Amborella trichopoda TaxID=13333 RepID=W1P9M7_AMBTC|nr:hypothetical protein AMTR_s00058p00160660 [Amborella trichopoda]